MLFSFVKNPLLPKKLESLTYENRHSPFESEKRIIEDLLIKSSGDYAIEIGAFLGSTTIRLAKICEETSKKLFVIDPWGATDKQWDRCHNLFLQRTSEFKCIEVIRKKSKDAINHLPDLKGKCAMVFVDGDHSYPACKFDLNHYYPLVSVGGVIVAHDLWFSKSVWRAFEEFSANKEAYYFKHKPTKKEQRDHFCETYMGLGWIYK